MIGYLPSDRRFWLFWGISHLGRVDESHVMKGKIIYAPEEWPTFVLCGRVIHQPVDQCPIMAALWVEQALRPFSCCLGFLFSCKETQGNARKRKETSEGRNAYAIMLTEYTWVRTWCVNLEGYGLVAHCPGSGPHDGNQCPF